VQSGGNNAWTERSKGRKWTDLEGGGGGRRGIISFVVASGVGVKNNLSPTKARKREGYFLRKKKKEKEPQNGTSHERIFLP